MGSKRAVVDRGVESPGRHRWAGEGARGALPEGIAFVRPRLL